MDPQTRLRRALRSISSKPVSCNRTQWQTQTRQGLSSVRSKQAPATPRGVAWTPAAVLEILSGRPPWSLELGAHGAVIGGPGEAADASLRSGGGGHASAHAAAACACATDGAAFGNGGGAGAKMADEGTAPSQLTRKRRGKPARRGRDDEYYRRKWLRKADDPPVPQNGPAMPPQGGGGART